MSGITSVLISGVGGQGILLASEILSDVALESGLDVKKSEVHGMAQRGGSVVSNVRFGQKVYSPIIKKGEADIILSFEKLETLRWLDHGRPGCTVLASTQQIAPMSVSYGAGTYPTDIEERVRAFAGACVFVDAMSEATALGNVRCVNVVLLGMLSARLSFEPALWDKVMAQRIKPKLLDLNRRAFARGVQLAS